MSRRTGWALLIAANVLFYCVLSFYRATDAAPINPRQPAQLPFANAVTQREQIINQLRELNESIKEQNMLLRSGNLKVIVHEP